MIAINTDNLNSRRLAFAEAVADGETQIDAYLGAYPRSSRKSAKVNSSRLASRPEVAGKVQELREKTETENTLSRQQKRELLAEFVQNLTWPAAARLRALDLDNRMAGHYEPEEVAHEFTVSLAERISERNGERGKTICIPPE